MSLCMALCDITSRGVGREGSNDIMGCVGMGSALLSEATHIEAQDATHARRLAPARGGARTRRRVAVVGLGKQALEDHIPGIAASDTADLVAVCDDNPDVLRKQEGLGVTPYRDFRQMNSMRRAAKGRWRVARRKIKTKNRGLTGPAPSELTSPPTRNCPRSLTQPSRACSRFSQHNSAGHRTWRPHHAGGSAVAGDSF